MNRKQIDFYEIVNFDEDTLTITMLDYAFKDGKDFKGLTGTKFEPISKGEYENRISEDSILERLRELYPLPKGYPNDSEYYQSIYDNMDETEKGEMCFDESYSEHWKKIRKALPRFADKSEYPLFDCVGGGRCFDKKDKFNLRPDLQYLIKEYES